MEVVQETKSGFEFANNSEYLLIDPIIFSIKRKSILDLSSLLVVGSSDATYENNVLFHPLGQSLKLICISKPVAVCSVVAAFKPMDSKLFEKNDSNSLLRFIARCMCTLLFCKY